MVNQGSRPSLSQIAVLHIAHSSRLVPAQERQAICLDDAELNNELLGMTDAYTDEIFPLTPVEAGRVVFPSSRLVCDVERFPSDETEPMAKRGMGAIYTGTSLGDVLRARRMPFVNPFSTAGTGRIMRNLSAW
jgi:N-formylglutamate deformylase